MWKTIDRISDPEGFVEKHVFTADSGVVDLALFIATPPTPNAPSSVAPPRVGAPSGAGSVALVTSSCAT